MAEAFTVNGYWYHCSSDYKYARVLIGREFRHILLYYNF